MTYDMMHDVKYDISSTLSWMCFDSSVVNKSYTLEPRRDYCDGNDIDNDWYDDGDDDYDSDDSNSYDYDDERIDDD